ncbi:MAG: helix-turn-helix domain-containing protein, partial [Clostridia bacterium]|nr:helix-turn-helix domain-containing protein [Clostridia bacterium]
MKTETELAAIIARNIAALRKANGWTQAQLAEKLNYSDKSVSKWERAEGMPDITVLVALSDLFQVSLDTLCREEAPPPDRGANRQRALTLILSIGLCWLIATVFFAAIRLFNAPWENAWLVYVYALPASSIIAVVFTSLWWHWGWQCLSVTCLIWTGALALDLSLANPQIWLVYIIAAVLQVLTVLWYWLRHVRRR